MRSAAAALRRTRLRLTLGALAALLLAWFVLDTPGHARAESGSGSCGEEMLLYELASAAVASRLSPGTEIEVSEHDPVTLSGESEWPLSFEVAASESDLAAHHYIDHGAATDEGGTPATYRFTSTKATAEEGDVYWQASFTRTLPNCQNESKEFTTVVPAFKIPARIIDVIPGEVELPTQETPGGRCGPHTCLGSATPSGLRVGITAAHIVHDGSHRVAYLISCTAACVGTTSFKASLDSRHSKPAPLAALDFGPRRFAISGASGGTHRVTDRFRGRALAKLRAILRGGGEVRLVIAAHVTDAHGKSTSVTRVELLRR